MTPSENPPMRTRVVRPADAADVFAALSPFGKAILLEDTGRSLVRRPALIGVDPAVEVRLSAGRVVTRFRDGTTETGGDLFLTMREKMLARFGLPAANERSVVSQGLAANERFAAAAATPGGAFVGFSGGWIGYFGYDVRTVIHPSPDRGVRDTRLPDAWFGLYDTFVESVADGFVVTTIASTSPEADAMRHARVVRAVESAAPLGEVPAPPPEAPVTSNFTRERYLAAIEATKERIRAGDCYQLNLTQRFAIPAAESPFRAYRRLRRDHGARYAAYFELDGAAVLSASPECFLDVDRRTVTTRPIKGTIARAADPQEDERARERLSASVKDRAELTMIVDLMRNDLNRAAVPGSVRVLDHATIESAPTVHHLVTGVTAELEDGKDVFDLLRAALPAGSITGCPKRRAMEIIDGLETVRRGVYTGSIGRIAADGSAELNVAIRTIVIEDGVARVSGGGGITIDSDPAAEYAETIDKVKGLLAVLGGKFRC